MLTMFATLMNIICFSLRLTSLDLSTDFGFVRRDVERARSRPH